NADVLNNRGNTLSAMGRYEEALAIYDRALALKPEFADALYNRGQALTWLDRHQEALESYDRSLAINPDNADALTNRGNTLQALNRYEEAVPCFERALALRPDQPEGHWNLALGLLAVCKFAEGWKEYEWRWKLPKSRSNLPVNACARRFLPQPSWTGRQVDGTLLVWGEQGLGDQILYASMLPDLASRAQSILVEIEPRLIPLFERSFAKVRAIGFGEKFDEADVKAQVGLASLGIFLRPSLESFPQRAGGFLKADPEMTASLRRRLSNTGKVVMGVSWISQNPRVGKFKTALLRDFEALLRLPGIRAIDLQYGDTLAERQTFEQETGVRVERLEDIDNTNDLDKLAALIAACDLVVTVSNTTAHLAGALGTPAWVFAPKAHGKFWYWFKDRPDSPWYPSVRIERQKIDQSWAEAIAAAVGEISAFLNAVQHSRIS
ncbi:MAG: tetratricopeptide repeat-containing glycosyltransferase family protein, partial [Xanthobacteraceae bacterium]